MNILITGGTGFIGRHFIQQYTQYQYTVLIHNRPPKHLPDNVQTITDLSKLTDLNNFDAVINLAGAPIVGKRWTEEYKQKIRTSRLNTTQQLCTLFTVTTNKPKVFLSGSAIGIYGDTGVGKIDESNELSIREDDFAQQLCLDWEKIARTITDTRLILLRTGIVLGRDGGALQQMLPAFKLGLGGPLGDGQQYMSWIHVSDMIKAIDFLLNSSQSEGPFNMVAPNPVTNSEFSQSLAVTLKRPGFLRVPKIVMKFTLGEAHQLLFDSQNILPARLQQQGFKFDYPYIKTALQALVGKKS